MEKLTVLLFLPRSMIKNYHYRYSFPTKLPELIASGRQSYLTAKETATNRILEANNLGLRIHDRSVAKLVESLKTVVSQYQESIQNSALFLHRPWKSSQQIASRKLRKILSIN